MKSLLITGSSRGIGLEVVRQYAEDGWNVFATARRISDELSAIANQHTHVQLFEVDVTVTDDLQKLKESIGTQPIDLLINNAAIFQESSLGSINYDEFHQTLNTNTMAPLQMAEMFMENIKSSTEKTIVNMTGHMGSLDFVSSHPDYFPGYYSYRVSKVALNMLTILLAHDLKKYGVKVIALSPGWVNTNMGGPNGELTPEQAVLIMKKFLADCTIDYSGCFFEKGKELAW